jgi:hypothetical protein
MAAQQWHGLTWSSQPCCLLLSHAEWSTRHYPVCSLAAAAAGGGGPGMKTGLLLHCRELVPQWLTAVLGVLHALTYDFQLLGNLQCERSTSAD